MIDINVGDGENNMGTGSEKKRNPLKEVADLFLFLFWIVFLGYIFPALCHLLINFFKLVIFGECKISEFDWQVYSLVPVNDFYQRMFEYGKDFIFGLKH
ncbi:MAG: hypothetical protein PHO30_05415 [Candidatus Omnitrophica bacterium]|nr:hypothetical protein [Candidatus Omnitrophota bacterium]